MGRYFFALWPDDDVRTELETINNRLPPGCGRKVRVENLHITLVFLGNVGDPQLERIRLAAEDIKGPVFPLTLDRCGWWKRPQVIWLGSDTIPAPLGELVARLNSVAAAHDVRVARAWS